VYKILILMIAGGGGHLASARAIAGALARYYGDQVSTSIVDVSKEHWLPPVNRMDDLYRWLSGDGVWLWKMLWWFGDRPWVTETGARILMPFFHLSLRRIFEAEKPDLVVGVHSFVNHIPLRVLRKTADTYVPFVTVITDMVAVHSTWCCPDVDYCMVSTAEARERAIGLGMPPDRVEVVGQPVALEFAANLGEKSIVRRRLELDRDRPCVLIVGGGDGVGPLYEIARAVATTVLNAQLIVVAGRNAELRQKLEQVTWEIPTQVYGFVDNMPELMCASDVLVTKAGPGTLAEAFIAGLPVIISGYIPGQEEDNVRYVLEHRAGAYATDPLEIADIVRRWFLPGDPVLEQVVANASALARPDAARVIARRLYAMLPPGPAFERGSGDLYAVEATMFQ